VTRDGDRSLRGAIHGYSLRLEDGSDSYPAGLALAPAGDLVIANSLGHSVCRLSRGGTLVRVAGSGMSGFLDGPGDVARLNSPKAVAVGADGTIFVADCDNHAVRRIDPETGIVATFVGRGSPGFDDGARGEATLRSPRGLAIEADGTLLVATMQAVRRIDAEGRTITLARNGRDADGGTPTTLGFLGGMTTDPRYGVLVTDTTHHAVWRIDARGVTSLMAGGNGRGWTDGAWEAAAFDKPRGILVDRAGRVIIADSKNDCLRILLPSGVTETVRGEDLGVDDGFDYPTGLALSPRGTVFVADQLNNRIYETAL
jgi:DNA-binding beta-propeller fold protein YncE